MGASIGGIGTSKIVIEGVESLYPANIDVIPDRIEAGTFLIAGALMGKITLNEVNPEHLDAVLQKLKGTKNKEGKGYWFNEEKYCNFTSIQRPIYKR